MAVGDVDNAEVIANAMFSVFSVLWRLSVTAASTLVTITYRDQAQLMEVITVQRVT